MRSYAILRTITWLTSHSARSQKPVLYGGGGLSKPDQYGDAADLLSSVFRDYRVGVSIDRHHFPRAGSNPIGSSLF